MSKTYSYQDMIILYCTVNEHTWIHEDFPNYRRKLVSVLQEIFDVDLTKCPENSSMALWMLFRSTTKTYKSAGIHPLSGYLEASLIHITLDRKSGPKGLEISELLRDLGQICDQKEALYQQILSKLYELILGATDRIVTSEDLAKRGFDDSQEPKRRDYYDYM